MCLVYCCREDNDVIRELASRAILKIANTEKGRVTLVSSRSLAIVANLFDDQVVQIRFNAYSCLINLAQFTFGISAIIDTDILRILVDKLIAEKEDIINVRNPDPTRPKQMTLIMSPINHAHLPKTLLNPPGGHFCHNLPSYMRLRK